MVPLNIFFELPDGMLIETVLMRQHYGLSVCDHQVGCIGLYLL